MVIACGIYVGPPFPYYSQILFPQETPNSWKLCPSEISRVAKIMGMKGPSVVGPYKFHGHSDSLFHACHIQTSAISNVMFDKFQFVVAYIHTLLLICCQEWGPLSYSPIREGLSILSHFLSLHPSTILYSRFSQVNSEHYFLPVRGV